MLERPRLLDRLSARLTQLRRAALVALGLFAAHAYLARFDRSPEPAFLKSWQTLAAQATHSSLGFLCHDPSHLTPLERSQLIAANWSLGPHPAQPLSTRDLTTCPDLLLSARYLPAAQREALQSAGYTLARQNAEALLWQRPSPMETRRRVALPPHASRTLRQLLTTCLLLSLLACVTLRLASAPRPRGVRAALALCVFLLLLLASLSHGLLAPNGLGVYAGKAKLWLAAGGIPDGFFTDLRFATYQPAYPPGLALLALLHFGASGVCAAGPVQLLVPAALTLLFVIGTTEDRSPLRTALMLLIVLSPLSVRMASAFCAEPFAALCLAAGLRRVLQRNDGRGWWIAGCAGLFRPEGSVVAAVFSWLLGAAGVRSRGRGILAAVLPGLAWQAAVRFCGGGLQDFAFASLPSGAALGAAALTVVKAAVFGAGTNGGLLLWLAEPGRALIAVLLAVAVGTCLVACTTSPHARWVFEETLPRYLWLVAVPLIITRSRNDHEMITICDQKGSCFRS